MTTKTFIIILFLLTLKSYAQWTFVGKYHRPNKGGGFTIQVNKDSTYSQKMLDCTWGFMTNGKWTTCNDTIFLKAKKLYGRSGKKLSLTIRTWNLETYQSMNKFILRNDTMFVVFKGKLRYPMTK